MSNDIRIADLTRTLPQVLKDDPKLAALASVIADELQETIRLSRHATLFARISELPEDILDILARDFAVGWYNDSYPIEVKRRLIRECVRVHKRQATKFAVETGLQAIYPHTTVQEWFEYGGEPYRFRVNLDIGEVDSRDAPDIEQIRDTVWLYKRLSAWLDGIFYVINVESKTTLHTVSGAVADVRIVQEMGIKL
jgi:phage tail P2-like protein